MPLSSWTEDEPNWLVRRRKIRPSKEVALAVDVALDDDEAAEDGDVGADGEGRLIFRLVELDNIRDSLELEETFWKLPWTKW